MTAKTQSWVTCREAAAVIGCSLPTFGEMVKRGEVESRRSTVKSRNGKFALLILESSLSANARLKLNSGAVSRLSNDAPLLNLTGAMETASTDALSEPRHLDEKQQTLIEERKKLIRPMIDFAEGRRAPLHLSDGREVRNLDDVAAWVAGHSAQCRCRARARHRADSGGPAQLSKALVWRLYSAYMRDGSRALEPRPRADRGKSRLFEKRTELQRFVAAKWMEVGNISLVADAVRREWGGPLLPYKDGSKPPSYDTIAGFVKKIPESVRDAVRLPKQKWETKHAPYLVTGRGEYTRPNQVWVADHRIYDVLVMNDFFPHEPSLAAIRLWETCIQDMRTRVIVGSVWNVAASWRTIASALKQGISRFGKPELFYADNGKDFRKVGVGAKRGSLLTAADSSAAVEMDEEGRVPFKEGLLARLGVEVCYCTPHHPQSKQIESYFSFVGLRFDRLFFGRGYTGPKPELRPDFCRDAEREHKEFLAGRRPKSPLCGASEFMRLHAQWLEERNNGQPHGGRGMNGQTPIQVMDEMLPPAERKIPDMAELAPLFWDVQKRIVTNCKVQLNSATYSAAPDDPEAQQGMYLANGSTVAVHCDPNDMACALAFEDAPSGRLLGRLVSDELRAQAPRTQDEVAAISRQRAKLRRASRDFADALATGIPSELDLLKERIPLAQRATGTDGAPAPGSPVHASPRRLAPAFVSDAVKRDAGIFANVQIEDETSEG